MPENRDIARNAGFIFHFMKAKTNSTAHERAVLFL